VNIQVVTHFPKTLIGAPPAALARLAQGGAEIGVFKRFCLTRATKKADIKHKMPKPSIFVPGERARVEQCGTRMGIFDGFCLRCAKVA
jgi:hypothetical protein